ncbi:hypothetical protein SVAN01_01294 [Stagonosporopsis vannaccii]|nr:hypothetical protein SVAN01_01294 [Stagonosporopsis vannaccii]
MSILGLTAARTQTRRGYWRGWLGPAKARARQAAGIHLLLCRGLRLLFPGL